MAVAPIGWLLPEAYAYIRASTPRQPRAEHPLDGVQPRGALVDTVVLSPEARARLEQERRQAPRT